MKKKRNQIPFVGTSIAGEWKSASRIWHSTLARCHGLAVLRSIGDGKIDLDGLASEVVVALDEYRFRFLGHDGAVDNSFHHSRATCEDAVGVSEQVEGAQRYQKAITKIAVDT